MSLNGLSEDTTISAGDGLRLSTAGVMTADVLQSEVDAKQDELIFNAPSSNNGNPSTSAQIKSALDNNALDKLDKPSDLGSSVPRLLKYEQSGIPNIAQVENISDVLTGRDWIVV